MIMETGKVNRQKSQMDGVATSIANQNLSQTVTAAILHSEFDRVCNLIQDSSSGRRVFKELLSRKETTALMDDELILQLEKRQEWDLAFTVAVAKGLWDKVLCLYDHEDVLPRSRRQALKTAVKQGAWDAVQTLVASHTTSHTHRRHAFLAAVRHNCFDVATKLCQNLKHLSAGDFKYSVRMFFAAGNHVQTDTSTETGQFEHFQTLCRDFADNSQLLCFAVKLAFCHKSLHLVWGLIDGFCLEEKSCKYHRRSLKGTKLYDFMSMVVDVAVKTQCWEFLEEGAERARWFSWSGHFGFLEKASLWKSPKYRLVLVSVVDKAIKMSLEGTYKLPTQIQIYPPPPSWSLPKADLDPKVFITMVQKHLPENKRKHLRKLCCGRFPYFGLALALAGNNSNAVLKHLNILDIPPTSRWDDLILEVVDPVLWKRNKNWEILVPVAERVSRAADSPWGGKSVMNKVFGWTQGAATKNVDELLKWCLKNKFFYSVFMLAFVRKDALMVLKVYPNLETSLSESWDNDIFNLTIETRGGWRATTQWKYATAFTERMIPRQHAYECDELLWAGEKIIEMVGAMADRLERECFQDGYHYTGLAVGLAQKDAKMIVRNVRKLEKLNSDKWYEVVFNTCTDMNARVWKSEQNWDVLIRVTEGRITSFEDIDEQVGGSASGVGINELDLCDMGKKVKDAVGKKKMGKLEDWCYENGFLNSAVCIGLVSGLKNWQRMLKAVEKIEDPRLAYLLCFFKAARQDKAFEAAMTSIKRAENIYRVTSEFLREDDDMIPLIIYCRSQGMDDWACRLAAYSLQWEIVKTHCESCDDPSVRGSALNNASLHDRWDVVWTLLQKCTGKESNLNYVLGRAVKTGRYKSAKLLLNLVHSLSSGYLTHGSMFTEALSASLKNTDDFFHSSRARENVLEMTLVCIQAGVATEHLRKTWKDDSPLFYAADQEWLVRLPLVKAVYESGACSQEDLQNLDSVKSSKNSRSVFAQRPWQMPADVAEFVQEVAGTVRSLKSLCRLAISDVIGCRPGRHDRITSLPLPSSLIDYLMFRDIERMFKDFGSQDSDADDFTGSDTDEESDCFGFDDSYADYSGMGGLGRFAVYRFMGHGGDHDVNDDEEDDF